MYGLWNAPKNKIVVKMFIMIMFAYSAIKKKIDSQITVSYDLEQRLRSQKT